MDARWVLALLVAAAMAGCIQVEVPVAPATTTSSTSTTTSAAPTPTAGPPAPSTGNIEGFVRDDSGPRAGVEVSVVGRPGHVLTGSDGGFALVDLAPGTQTVRAVDVANNRSVQRSVEVIADDTVIAFLTLPAITSDEAPAPPVAPPARPTFTCEGSRLEETWWTHGQGDPAVPGLVWGAFKTGYRFAVSVPHASGFTLDYRAGTDAWRSVTSNAELLILDGLPEGRDMCFKVTVGSAVTQMHAVRLANAANAWDPIAGAYTLNLLIMAAEEPERDVLEKGLGIYHETLWDSTDGYVRPGLTLLAYGPPEWVQYSAEPCSTPGVGINYQPLHDLACAKVFDVGFTFIQDPQAAGSTYKDGIQSPRIWVRMNQLWEAGPIFSYNNGGDVEVGRVLTHELGHYVFGMDDLYASAGITTQDCYQSGTGISIMGGDRDATEFDSANTPCGNIASGATYVPSWTYLRERFDRIPERIGPPLEGPAGDGGAARLVVLDLS